MTDDPIVILGEADDIQVQEIKTCIEDTGYECLVLDHQIIENDITIAATIDGEPDVYYQDSPLTPSAIYWDNIYFLNWDDNDDHCGNSFAYTKLFLEAFKSARWVNPAPAFYDHYTKIEQYRKINYPSPATLFTNDSEMVNQFFSVFKPIAVKPIAGGDYTLKINTEEELELIDYSKLLTIQEYIEGINIRTFVVGDQVYSGAIDTSLVDFRIDKDFTYEATELAHPHEQAAVRIARALGYQWTAIDWILKDDELYFLEANFAPRYLFFQDQTGHPITESIVGLLIQ